MAKIYYFEGKYLSGEQLSFTINNRAFRYGDSVFESIAFFRGHAPLLPLHFERLTAACAYACINLPAHFTLNYIRHVLLQLATQIGAPETAAEAVNARIRLCIWRSDGGLYAPTNNNAQYLIEAEPLPHNGFVLNKTGLRVGICPYPQPSAHVFGGFKTGSALQYVRAALYKQEQGWDDCILTDACGQWLETTNSNLFVCTTDNRLLTPPPLCGVQGVMRRQILQWAKQTGIDTGETAIYGQQYGNTEQISEIWCTNAVQGIRWVGQWNGVNLRKEWAEAAVEALNKTVVQKR